jgi:hypothetical protein
MIYISLCDVSSCFQPEKSLGAALATVTEQTRLRVNCFKSGRPDPGQCWPAESDSGSDLIMMSSELSRLRESAATGCQP